MEASTAPPPSQPRHQWLVMAALIFAGEAIFFLPFVLPRVFRPTLLEVFELTNLQLGWAFSAYGIVAMLSYFPGGPLADRFGPRRLMTIALISTALGGVVLAIAPSSMLLAWLYGLWGLTTIFLFWAGLIRATRQWGGAALQGRAFGLLDGGRGLVAAAIGSVAVFCFSTLLPVDVETASMQQRSDAFTQIIWLFTGATLFAAAFVWWVLPETISEETTSEEHEAATQPLQARWSGVGHAIRMPVVWLQAVIVLCAYVGYKGLDDVSLYAKEALGFNDVSAAYASTISMWMRPAAAIIAGLLADRSRATTATAISFLLLTASCLVIASGSLQDGMLFGFFATIIATSAAVFALRGLYFAIMQEGHIPLRYTGSAVGIVSAIGYTPDIFMGPLMGVLLDRAPDAVAAPAAGHQQLFAIIACFSGVGLIATLMYRRMAVAK